MDRRSSKLGRAGMGMLGALALGAALAAMVPGCGADTPADPCETVYAGQCGTECFDTSACPGGLYCGPGGTCTADCT
ncbi:MAG TPA: hypothetical protein VLS89_08690, partial [Candidatus Nanopelagicales bacterium]|nr:hypothetical protein [Candidatus Nanopelagicales bacterium]